jgi:hypothetical protein
MWMTESQHRRTREGPAVFCFMAKNQLHAVTNRHADLLKKGKVLPLSADKRNNMEVSPPEEAESWQVFHH